MTFLYTKIQTLLKNQDNLRNCFIYKNPDTLCYAIFHGIFEIGGGGGIFIFKNNALCVTFLYEKTMQFALYFYIQRNKHFKLRFNMQKTMHFELRFYIFNLSYITGT